MDFNETISQYRNSINQELDKYLGEKINALPAFGNVFMEKQKELIKKYCLRNGKRLRPILTLISYEAVGGRDKNKILLPTLAFELYHNHTLIHDDIYDEDELRRGELSNHVLFQNWLDDVYKTTVLESDLYKDSSTRFGVVAGFINGKYLETLSGLPILEASIPSEKKVAGLDLLRQVSIYDNTGQAIDLVFEFEDIQKVKEEDYYNMVLCKTGRLFKASIEWGAVLGDASDEQLEVLRNYADNISLVFQIKDDLLDIESGGDKSRGMGSDIKKGKKTLLMIHALNNANSEERDEIRKIFGKTDASDEEIRKVIKILKKLGSVKYCEKIALERATESIKLLKSIELIDEYKEFLEELAIFMFKRDR